MDEQMLKDLEKVLNEKFPFGIPRKEIGKATGGVLHPNTMANLDCVGEGIPGRFKIGRNTIYTVKNTVSFIKNKIVVVPNREVLSHE